MEMPALVATVGAQTCSTRYISEMIQNGADILRYNSATKIDNIYERIADAQAFIKKNYPKKKIGILADMPIPGKKVRLSTYNEGSYTARKNKRFYIVSAKVVSGESYISVDTSSVGDRVKVGQTLIVGDGELAFNVVRICGTDCIEIVCMNDWIIKNGKSISLSNSIKKDEKDQKSLQENIQKLSGLEVDMIAFSFIEKEEELINIHKCINHYKPFWTPKIVAKIESKMGIDNILEIIKYADIILVARGDLAIYESFERLGVHQKYLCNLAKKRSKKIFVATQIIESSNNYSIINRAEILDITNMVIDRIDGIVLSKETSSSKSPGYPISIAKKIMKEVVLAYKRKI